MTAFFLHPYVFLWSSIVCNAPKKLQIFNLIFIILPVKIHDSDAGAKIVPAIYRAEGPSPLSQKSQTWDKYRIDWIEFTPQ
jgi:hypothetical protein